MRWSLLSLSLLVAGNSWAQQANAAIEGQVLNSVTNAPVRKAVVNLYYHEKPGSSLTLPVEADLSGRFEFKGLQPGAYEIDAEGVGYYGSMAIGLPGKSVPSFTLSAGQTLTAITLRLTPGSAVSGRIADEDDDPLAGIQVHLFRWLYSSGGKELRETGHSDTDDRGRYRISGIRQACII